MERIIHGIYQFYHGNKRQMITALALIFIVYVLLLAGIFSYFHSEDSVTNRLSSQKGSVTIHEPNWDQTGQYMAANHEPGMEIPKDPFGWNDGNVDVYIRLVMTVETIDQDTYNNDCSLPDAEDIDAAVGEIGKKTEAERLNAIVNAIKYIDENDEVKQFMTLNGSQEIVDCKNTNFYYDAENHSTDSNKLIYYFYYTAGDENESGDHMMHRVATNQGTDALFQRIDIPKFKKDYLGIFDFDYSITLKAEAIPVESDTLLTLDEAKVKFGD